MGSPAEVVLEERGERVYIYSHWDGYDTEWLPLLASALNHSQNRWDDAPYMNRMIFSLLISDDVWGETGYGLSAHHMDSMQSPVVICHDDQTVYRDNTNMPRRVPWREFMEDPMILAEKR